MRTGQNQNRTTGFRVLALLCVLFVGFIGFVQANHSHTGNSRLPSHECSVCAVAHAGVLHQVAFRPIPVFVRCLQHPTPDVAVLASRFRASFYIRPPPAA